VEARVHVHKIAHTSRVDAHAIAVAVVGAVFFRAVTAAEPGVALALAVVHATSVETTLVLAGSDAAVRASPAFFALATAFDAVPVSFAVIRAALLGTVVACPHLAFKRSCRFLDGLALALAGVDIAIHARRIGCCIAVLCSPCRIRIPLPCSGRGPSSCSGRLCVDTLFQSSESYTGKCH